MNNKRKVKMSLYLTVGARRKLERFSKRVGMTMSELIETLIVGNC